MATARQVLGEIEMAVTAAIAQADGVFQAAYLALLDRTPRSSCPKCRGSGRYEAIGQCYRCAGLGLLIRRGKVSTEFARAHAALDLTRLRSTWTAYHNAHRLCAAYAATAQVEVRDMYARAADRYRRYAAEIATAGKSAAEKAA